MRLMDHRTSLERVAVSMATVLAMLPTPQEEELQRHFQVPSEIHRVDSGSILTQEVNIK